MCGDEVAAVLLAAGASRRLGHAKQLLADASGTVAVVRVARALHEAGYAPVVVVLGAHATEVGAALAGEEVELVTNSAWQHGMGSSIAVGIAALARLAPESPGALICPCDMPAVTVSHLRALRTHFDGRTRVASTYGNAVHEDAAHGDAVRGIPAILPREDWPWLAALIGDSGARPLLRDARTRTVALPGGEFDLDTPSDLARWHEHTGRATGDNPSSREPR